MTRDPMPASKPAPRRTSAFQAQIKRIMLAHIARAFGVSPEEAERRLKAAECDLSQPPTVQRPRRSR
jgi:hypothetical protein